MAISGQMGTSKSTQVSTKLCIKQFLPLENFNFETLKNLNPLQGPPYTLGAIKDWVQQFGCCFGHIQANFSHNKHVVELFRQYCFVAPPFMFTVTSLPAMPT